MPMMFDDPIPAGPCVSVHGSIAIELEWVMATAGQPQYQRDHADLAAIYRSRPELRERVTSFWPDDMTLPCSGFLELAALAHHGGLLFSTDAPALLGRLEALCADAPGGLRFDSETDHDRRVLLSRLTKLRSSPSLRRRYVALIEEVWAAVAPVWDLQGRAAVDASVAAGRRRLDNGAAWTEVAAEYHCFDSILPALLRTLGPSGDLVVVPAYFTHKSLVVDLPGLVVIGIQTMSGVDARAATETLARRLRVIADPTRLAIMAALTSTPRTVSELAGDFQLSQPTVSNHVKLLRDAQLVVGTREGSRRPLSVLPGAVGEILENLRSVLQTAGGF